MIAGDPDADAPATPLSGATAANILGVDYWHVKTRDEGDLYVTRHGAPVMEHLLPRNWHDADWFEAHRERLEGTSTVYKTRTREVNGRQLDIVVKWCRVGEEVPFNTATLNKFAEVEFNSPYEEFALVDELRRAGGPPVVRTHRPLAIYVPAERLQLWQTGRSQSKIAQKKAKHRDIELDIYRQYILIYEWIKGVSIVEALEGTDLPREERWPLVEAMTRRATDELGRLGFRVLDMKPAHIIVRPRPDRTLLHGVDGTLAYALVDFELLQRTPEHEVEVKQARRSLYLRKQRDRFEQPGPSGFPSHLHAAGLLGVDYVAGSTESTQGQLWVVGRDPGLFDYFQPERWRRTPRTKLSDTNEVYYTKTKDEINIVWKVSRVGEQPETDPSHPAADRIVRHGYNSPFEEFATALRLTKLGLPTVYPRAVYMTGLESERPDYIEDPRRYQSHRDLRNPDGSPILRPNHLYITIWGFWNGLDELLANRDQDHCRGISLTHAVLTGYVSRADAQTLLDMQRARLAAANAEDLNLKGDHLLLTLSPDGVLQRNADGRPEVRFCNFELLRWTQPPR